MTDGSVDTMVVAAHPDDAELAVGGLLELKRESSKPTGVLLLTHGERGTRGTPDDRRREAAAAAEVLGLRRWDCIALPDARLEPSVAAREALAAVIRAWRPRLLIGHGESDSDPHPDHAAAARLTREAWFVAGLAGLDLGAPPHRPERRLTFAVPGDGRPDLVVPIDAVWEAKLAALRCHATQMAPGALHRVGGSEPLATAERNARLFGEWAGCTFAEGLNLTGPLVIEDPTKL